jgi:vancomycin resistance protein YoaR
MATVTAPTTTQDSFLVVLARWLAALAATLAILASAAGVALGAIELAYANTVYPGISVHGIDISGLTRAQAVDRLSAQFTYPERPAIVFHYKDRVWNATPVQLGARFTVEETVGRAFGYGRSGNWANDLQDQFWAWYQGDDIAPIMVYEPGRGAVYLSGLAAEIDSPPVEAALSIQGAQVSVTPGKYGYTVNIDKTLRLITEPLRRLGTANIDLVIDEYKPGVLDASAQAAVAQQILSQPLTLTIADAAPDDPGPWVFTPEQLASLLAIQRVDDAQGARYEVALKAAELQPFLETLAPKLERKPRDARFTFNDQTRQLDLVAGREALDGRALNVAATIQSINSQVVTGVHTVPLVFDIQKPKIGNTTTAADLGITGLVSSQITYFAGSSAERVNNIRVGAAAFYGILIPPGGTFSFDGWLGDISLDTGFSEALIIYAGRTIKGVGGGICQVSTTAFRTAFFGGYPIVERHSHAYQVHWYDKGTGETPNGNTSWNGPGLDATIFSPVADFQFTNDRSAWLLIETYLYNNQALQFKFYSADDGRKVAVDPAVVSDVVPAPPDKYELNKDLASGQIKQADYSADGANTSVHRLVTRDGKTLYEDTLRTKYLPWQAVYDYGPGTTLPVPVDENGVVITTPTPSP